jgi:hypothetical protein
LRGLQEIKEEEKHDKQVIASDFTDGIHKKPHSLPNLVGQSRPVTGKSAVLPFSDVSETAQTAKIG